MSTEKRIHTSEIPEGDLLDQTIPIDPSGTAEAIEGSHITPDFVNDADWIDQQILVPVDDSEQERS